MQNFVTKIGSAVALLINGELLNALKYDQNIPMTKQNPTFMKWQWPMFIVGPAVGAILYLLVIVFVNDDHERRDNIEAQLKQRRMALAEKTEVV